MTQPRGIVVNATLSAFGLVLGLALGEGGVRLSASLSTGLRERLPDPTAVLIEPLGLHGYRAKPNTRIRYPNGAEATTNAAGYRGPLVDIRKPPGTLRVLLLGGSATHGWGVNDSQTIDTYLRAVLNRPGGPRVEVVNLALDGYDSYQLYERLRSEGLAMQPDIVVVNSGINDVRNARIPHLEDRDPRTLIWEPVLARLRQERDRGGPTWWTQVKHHSYVARLPAYFRQQQHRREELRASLNAAPSSAAADYFERNLRRIAALARAANAALLFSTPPSALSLAYAPTDTSSRSYWIRDAATTEQYRLRLADRMRIVAHELAAAGQAVPYVAASLPRHAFLDDCHLTPQGNKLLAAQLVRALEPILAAYRPVRPLLHN